MSVAESQSSGIGRGGGLRQFHAKTYSLDQSKKYQWCI